MMEAIEFQPSPEHYRHWKLDLSQAVEHGVAQLILNIPEEGGLRSNYTLKLNSYDLGVDIELADCIQRLRFEHPEVRAVVLTSGKDKIFSSGANIYMLGSSTHAFKVNFCKFTNETRLYLEEMSAETGIRTLAALNGTASGGGYELALACDEIVLQEDGSSTVSLPECPLLGVLPGTGGLTRLVDKRKIRRDHADVFCTLAEGLRGARAKEWKLIDAVIPRSKFREAVATRARVLAQESKRTDLSGTGIQLNALKREQSQTETTCTFTYKYVTLSMNLTQRTAELKVFGPDEAAPATIEALHQKGDAFWALQAFRELDNALLELRFNYPTIGTISIQTKGSIQQVLAYDRVLDELHKSGDWLAHEILLLQKRVLKRLDLTARSFFAIVDEGSCFAGSLYEIALACDRIYMKEDETRETEIQLTLSVANFGSLPMSNGLTRLQTRFLNDPNAVTQLKPLQNKPIATHEALKLGLITLAPDAIDWGDEVRIAIEERASLSPDAMTGMEASLRFAGPETLETKIFGRLSAWQNWIFIRPNATGEKGALTMYGRPERAEFNWTRC